MNDEEINLIIDDIKKSNIKPLFKNLDDSAYGESYMLFYLNDNGDKKIIADDLAKELNVSNPRVSKLIKRMELKHLIVKKNVKDDARAKYIKLTNAGINKVIELKEKFIKGLKELVNKVGIDNIREYIRLSILMNEATKEEVSVC